MNALEWNPSFGPVATAVIVLVSGVYFYFLLQRLIPRHGKNLSWLLLIPKVLIVALLIVALLDPELVLSGGNSNPAKVLILQDISSSMDLRDEGSTTRSDRSTSLINQLKSDAPASIHFEVLPFDSSVHEAGYQPKDAATRTTSLAAMFLALASQPNLSDADGIIVVTDGGDEMIDAPQMPAAPLAIIGVGSPPEGWNDLGIADVTAPSSAEENSAFDLVADLSARSVGRESLSAVKVVLEQGVDKTWNEVQSQTVDLTAGHAAATFHIPVKGSGSLHYRVRLPEIPGELTYANNSRTVNVQVQQRALHVLYFTQELGVDYKYLRNELGTDPGVVFTAMYRVLEDQFTVQGDRTGYQDLARGFPDKEDVLKRYDCIILGSFSANQFNEAQTQALVHYVENGGALIWLGGQSSFGRGGYADSKLAPLLPWAITNREPDLATGNFPVNVPPSGAALDLTAGLREDLNASGGATLESLNQPGGLRPGAIALLDATTANHTEPVVAWQRYGQGQVLGIATNTLWKWAAQGHARRALFGRFWRQAVRGLTKKQEGGSLLGIRWNQEHYRPGEQAVVEVRLREPGGTGALRLVSTLTTASGEKEVSLKAIPGEVDAYSGRIPLMERGDATFRLSAYKGSSLVESYERVLPVEPLVEEGGAPELKDAYLKQIAERAKGVYTDEKHLEPVEALLRGQIRSQRAAITVPLIDFWNVFGGAIIVILLTEWIVRRRRNLI